MKQRHNALAAMFTRHQRRSIFQRCPTLRNQRRIRFGEHLAADGDILRHEEARERTIGREGCEVLRLFPSQAAAETSAAMAQLDRHQVVIGLRQMGPRKTDQYPALRDPCRDAFANFRRERPDVGKHNHREFLVEKLRDHLLRSALVTQAHISERT